MKIALITGSGRKNGLGFETAKQLGAKGYHIILAARNMEQMTSLIEELSNLGISTSSVMMDITDDKSILDAAATVEKQDIDELKNVFITNVIGTWSVTQKFLPLLIKSDQGRIVNISSGAGSFGNPQYGFINGTLGMPGSGYAISKLALNGLTIKMAKEFEKYKILVNSVCPDITDTYGTGGVWGRSCK